MTYCIAVQARIEEELKQREIDEEERIRALQPPTPKSSSTEESDIDEDFNERRKQAFNVRENIEQRKVKNSLMDTPHETKLVSLDHA
jgi:hypothetical protein